MNKQELKWFFIMTIIIILCLFTVILLAFNTIEGMSLYDKYASLEKIMSSNL